jgi:hypothetical protein
MGMLGKKAILFVITDSRILGVKVKTSEIATKNQLSMLTVQLRMAQSCGRMNDRMQIDFFEARIEALPVTARCQ